MSTLTVSDTADGTVPVSRDRHPADGLFDLDLRVHVPQQGEPLWSMTNNGCGKTCETACTPSCTDNG